MTFVSFVLINLRVSVERKQHRPELLAPAGDFEAMRAAVANGADAVYFGLPNFNARHRAENFTLEKLPETMKFLHDHNVKGFLTFNTLIFSDELPAAADYIRAIAAAGVDAVIVQDLGLARLIHAMCPSLNIHGSTQMTLTEPRGIEFVRRLGVVRVVLARENTLDDIRRIAATTDMPTEVFVHGALCVAYSGQCLTSESIGGRSANRGQCAQACRLPYDLIVDGMKRDLDDKSYLLSPQDLAAHDLIADLTSAGVASFKIEGRLKSAHYVAATSQTYRAAIDAAIANAPFQITESQRGDLAQTFSRGFTHGFLSGVNHQALVHARFPKSRGRRIGTVAGIDHRGIVIELDRSIRDPQSAIRNGDGVVFDEGHPEQDEQGGRVFAVAPSGRNRIRIELGNGDVNPHAIPPGSIVWKTDDPAIRKRLEHSFSRDVVANRIPLDATLEAHVGAPARLVLTLHSDGRPATATATSQDSLQAANKHPVNEATAREQLSRLGDTPFELHGLQLKSTGGPMIPKSVLNDLRRRAVEELLSQLDSSRIHAIDNDDALTELRAAATAGAAQKLETVSTLDGSRSRHGSLHVLCRTLEQVEAVLAHHASGLRASVSSCLSSIYCDFEDVRRYRLAVERCTAIGMPIAVATMRIVKPHEEGWLEHILRCNPTAVIVRSLAAISFFRQKVPQLPLIGDFSLNIANELTAQIFADTGLIRFVPSYDLNWQQMAAMLARFDASRFECVVHQHMPMFHMEHCVFAHTLSSGKDYRDCGRPCETHKVDLRDRVGADNPLIPDAGCRNTVYNGQAQSAAEFVPRMQSLGIRHFRIELLREGKDEVAPIVERYDEIISGQAEPAAAVRSLRVLQQLGVTAGTLEHD